MSKQTVHFFWLEPDVVRRFRTGICLHGHTLYSQECLSFLPRYLHQVPGISQLIRRYEKPNGTVARGIDFGRAYWTPPLTPLTAFRLEQQQMSKLGLQPIVSLTDHDNINASILLQLTAESRAAPVSVEWTVPYGRSILHLGIHNIPAGVERPWLTTMAEYTAAPEEHRMPHLLESFARIPEVLIILNHPFWLEEGVQDSDHRLALPRFLGECLPWIHALELNGTRSWKENAAVVRLAESYLLPFISGGDRHAGEPAACINLTNAQSFAEFVSEVRCESSTVLFLPQYRNPMGHRILEASWDIVRSYPEYPGREHWTDRFFYYGEDGIAQPLSLLWKGRVPWMLDGGTRVLQAIATTRLSHTLRFFGARREESLP